MFEEGLGDILNALRQRIVMLLHFTVRMVFFWGGGERERVFIP